MSDTPVNWTCQVNTDTGATITRDTDLSIRRVRNKCQLQVSRQTCQIPTSVSDKRQEINRQAHPISMPLPATYLLLFASLCSLVPQCTGGKWFHKNNIHYYFSSVQSKWGDAQSNCASMGARLATISSSKENNYLLRRNPSNDPRSGMSAHWIGLKGFCGGNGCTFEWDSSADVDEGEFMWAPGYPNTEQYLTYVYLGK